MTRVTSGFPPVVEGAHTAVPTGMWKDLDGGTEMEKPPKR